MWDTWIVYWGDDLAIAALFICSFAVFAALMLFVTLIPRDPSTAHFRKGGYSARADPNFDVSKMRPPKGAGTAARRPQPQGVWQVTTPINNIPVDHLHLKVSVRKTEDGKFTVSAPTAPWLGASTADDAAAALRMFKTHTAAAMNKEGKSWEVHLHVAHYSCENQKPEAGA